MMRHASVGLMVGLTSALACALASGFAVRAEAQSLDACNNIHVEVGADCEVRPPSAQCDAMCTPVSVQAACAAEAYVNCDASCNVDIEVGCSATCQGDCTAECTGSAGMFDCEAYCQGDCKASCDGECAANDSRCHASCDATCTGDCNARCKVEPPMLDCQAECRASCEGSCKGKAEIDCQAMCQSKFYAKCEVDVQGGCKVDCTTDKGALFCDGDYVKTTNLDECVKALRAKFKVNIVYEADATGSSQSACDGGVCSGSAGGTAKASASCSALPGSSHGAASWALVFVGLAACVARRRR